MKLTPRLLSSFIRIQSNTYFQTNYWDDLYLRTKLWNIVGSIFIIWNELWNRDGINQISTNYHYSHHYHVAALFLYFYQSSHQWKNQWVSESINQLLVANRKAASINQSNLINHQEINPCFIQHLICNPYSYHPPSFWSNKIKKMSVVFYTCIRLLISMQIVYWLAPTYQGKFLFPVHSNQPQCCNVCTFYLV